MVMAVLIEVPLCIGIEFTKIDSMIEVGLPAAMSSLRTSHTIPERSWPQVWIALPQLEQPLAEYEQLLSAFRIPLVHWLA